MTTARNLLAGLGGAIALNLLHEALKKTGKDMPRIDKLGEEAVQKGLATIGQHIDNKDNLYAATLGADVLSNAMYFSLIGAGNPKHIWPKAITMGLAAGTGAVALAGPMGLNPDPVAKSKKTEALTAGYYLFGALVTGGLLKLMDRENIR